MARSMWTVAPGALGLLPGTYSVSLVLDTRASTSPQAWKGKVENDAVPLEVLASIPSDLEPGQRLLAAAYWRASGDPTRARAEVDALLAQAPDDIDGLMLRGDLQDQVGAYEDALASYEAALAALEARGIGGNEPPLLLLRRIAEVSSRVSP